MTRSLFVMLAVSFGLTGCGETTPPPAGPADKPAETAGDTKLVGTLMCGKCSLDVTPKCSNVLQVKEGDKTVDYFIDDRGAREWYHEGVCGDGKIAGVTVVGTVTEKDGKKWVKATKVELPKQS